MKDIRYEELTELTDSQIELILDLNRTIFEDPFDFGQIKKRFMEQSGFVSLFAYKGDQLVGFKVGHKVDEIYFYSWLGGVHPDYRGLGIAKELMILQHKICKAQGYKVVSTKTQNQFKNMLIFNLKFGFEIIKTEPDKNGVLEIYLEKPL